MIRGHRVVLRPVEEADTAALHALLVHPGVRPWWGDPDEQLVEVMSPPEEITSYAIVLDGVVVGVIQSNEELTPDYRSAGMDIAVHPDWHGQGVGTDALVALARYLLDERGHHRLTIDPSVGNEIAIGAYRRIGFRPVGVMRQYCKGPEGWEDGLLMDLLADELVDPLS